MESLKKIVMLIDADNAQLNKLEDIIRELSAYGRIVVKRAYGNWRKDTLKRWEPELKRLAIKAEQQFDYVTGKNTTDIALTIDAMDLLHTELYDSFIIVASDSDYTPPRHQTPRVRRVCYGCGRKENARGVPQCVR